MPRSSALRAGLLADLVRRPLWLAGTAAGAIAFPMQAAALALGSVAVVQPALAFALVVLLLLGVTVLHEPVGLREIAGVATIVGSIALLGWAAPAETGAFTTAATWGIGVALVLLGAAPLLLRIVCATGGLPTSIAAGLGWAGVGLAVALVDDAVGARRWVAAALWLAGVGVASFGALLEEQTAFQTMPATRAMPVMFSIETVLPAALVPLLTHARPPHAAFFGLALAASIAGAALLGTSRAVASTAAPLTAP
jgi:drug/metabolite transporter (DMT)-like permease